MKKLLLTIAISAITIIAMSETVIYDYCAPCICKYCARAPEGWAICTKDSVYQCNAIGLPGCNTLSDAQARFDSLYIILPQGSITKWPEY